MTNSRSTKRALIASVISVLLCVSMLLGTTYAWFTDSVTSANNIIVSGNLDVELEYWDGDSWENVDGAKDILTNNLFEPGATEVAYLRVANAGSLALKYQLGINVVSETEGVNVAGKTFKLSDYVMFGVKEILADATTKVPTTYATREEAVAAVTNAQKISAGYTKAASMTAGQELYLALVVYMPTSVGNEANHDGTNKPQIDLGINVVATQFAKEEDSFGADYDNGAAFVTAPAARPENATTGMNLKGANDVVISLPAEVINALPEGVEEIGMAVSDPVIDATSKTLTFDSVELIDQNGKKIDLDALDLTKDITVTLPLPENAPFDAGEKVMVYHDGVYVATATITEDGKISYDVAHLCEVTIGTIETPAVKDDGTIEIANVAQLISFAQSVNAGNSYAGKTVVLTADIDLNNVEWTPIGNWDNAFDGTFDGKGKVIKNLYINDADGEGIGFFGVTEKATLKNVTIENVNIKAYSMVAGLVGAAYPATIEKCHITGDVNIVSEWAYVAGIAGYCYYDTQVTDCSTIAEDTGLIKSETRNAVGGITAWLLEGNHNVTSCTVKNLDLVGWTNVGGITGFVHYNNTIADCTVENVTLTKTRVDGNPGIGLIAGGWSYSAKNAITLKNNTVNNATMSGNHKVYTAWNQLYGSEYDGVTTTNFVLDNNIVENVVNKLTQKTVVKDGEALKAALAKGEDVIFANDITMAATSGGYSKAGIVVSEGQIVDGNGYTLKVTGAGDTWDCAICLTNGTVKNLSVTGAFRGIFMSGASGDVYIDNVVLDKVCYTFNSDAGNKNYGVYISNTTLNGWTSYSNVHKEVVFTNCTFGQGTGAYDYAYCRPYNATVFENCTFSAGYTFDKSQTSELIFKNCTGIN